MTDSRARLPDQDPGSAEAGIGYLWIPHLPLAVALTQHPEVADCPTVLVATTSAERPIMDASDDCLRAGVKVGQPLREAQEFCPESVVLPANPGADRQTHERVLSLLETMVPAVEDDGPGRAYFAVAGPASHDDHRRFLAFLRTLVQGRLGLSPRIVLAPGKFSGRIAAEYDARWAATGIPLILESHDVMAYLAPLPLDVVPLSARARERLRQLAIRTVGQFAELPQDGIGRRFGTDAMVAHSLARGLDTRPVVPRRRPEVRSSRHAFAAPVETVEPLLAIAEGLVDALCAALQAEGKAFQSLTVMIEQEDGKVGERTAALRSPMSALSQCRTTLRILVEAVARGGPAAALTVTLSALRPADGIQLSLLDGAAGIATRRQQIEAVAREILRRYPERLRRIAPQDVPTLLDEYHFRLLPYDPDGDRRAAPSLAGPSARTVRIMRRGSQSYLVDTGRWDEVVTVHGCWRAEEWWPAEVTRVYWRVRTRSGRVCTISRDKDGWRLVEVFD